jgi:hypothetical protein
MLGSFPFVTAYEVLCQSQLPSGITNPGTPYMASIGGLLPGVYLLPVTISGTGAPFFYQGQVLLVLPVNWQP